VVQYTLPGWRLERGLIARSAACLLPLHQPGQEHFPGAIFNGQKKAWYAARTGTGA